MMVIRGVETPAVTADNAIRTFENIGGRVWRPNTAALAAFAGRRYTQISTTPNTITLLERNGTDIGATFRNGSLGHWHFDENNNLILGDDFGPVTQFTVGDELTVAANGLSYIPSTTVYNLYPADRCTWRQTYESNLGGYQIYDATFYNGVDANGAVITDPALGYIGKSGRFVEIAG